MHQLTETLLASTLMLAASGRALAQTHAYEAPSSDDASRSASAPVAPHTISLALGGYSPVSYIEERRAEPGSPRFAEEHDGVTYFFTSDRQRRVFRATPERYLPAYGGYCAFGCSVDSKFTPDPESFEIIDGRTHLFLRNDDVDARKLWSDADLGQIRSKADRFWSAQGASKAYVHARNVPASGVGLDGYSPVSYFTVGRAEKGDPRFTVERDGVTYHLTSQAQVEQFNESPGRYEPQCGGWCAFGMSVEDKFPVDPTKFKVIDDKLYLFLNNAEINAFDLWEQGNQSELVRKAQSHWKKVSGE